MDVSQWSAQYLAEFAAAISIAGSEATAARISVERAAEALDADVAAIVSGDDLVAAVGYAQGDVPVAELARVQPGAAETQLVVPGVGVCMTATATLEYPIGATLLVARTDALTRQETGLLHGMARVASTTMRMRRVLADERATREELERLAREQAALRHVATLVARGVPPTGVFAVVAEEVGRLFAADATSVVRFDADGAATWVGSWSATGQRSRVGLRRALVGQHVTTIVFQTGRPARLDGRPTGDSVATTDDTHDISLLSVVGAPITVERRLWGSLQVASSRETGLPSGTEERLSAFAELVAAAIANAEARAELTASRARIVATADETRRRIERDLHDGAQQRLVTLALQLRALQETVPPELGELAAELDALAAGLTNALDELREFARGIHPALLTESGLGPAVRMLTRRCPMVVHLDLRLEGRPRGPVEVAAYYVVSEALANAVKYANATTVAVDVETADEYLRVSVRDDGVGGADATSGSGLLGLRDRVEALGGRLVVESPRGAGTSVRAELPLTDGIMAAD
ncbi:GAF domain-containing protein [Jiangella aurantiaca]|uniref:histidine kinase n=1 Tax=Jiangella aurantiaca TaxID=2530373 RepID=A0A4R5A9A8_9ACTN|nr:histidine kinase [Jiangella aurantiaca]TDD68651.1 GAF domain-containing protein [Jiangella aurantiaca]